MIISLLHPQSYLNMSMLYFLFCNSFYLLTHFKLPHDLYIYLTCLQLYDSRYFHILIYKRNLSTHGTTGEFHPHISIVNFLLIMFLLHCTITESTYEHSLALKACFYSSICSPSSSYSTSS